MFNYAHEKGYFIKSAETGKSSNSVSTIAAVLYEEIEQ